MDIEVVDDPQDRSVMTQLGEKAFSYQSGLFRTYQMLKAWAPGLLEQLFILETMAPEEHIARGRVLYDLAIPTALITSSPHKAVSPALKEAYIQGLRSDAIYEVDGQTYSVPIVELVVQVYEANKELI